MNIQELFDEWWNGDAMAVRANLAANDEEIAFTAFWAGFKAAQHRVQRIAFGAGAAGFLLGVVVSLIVVFVQIGVR